MIASRSLGMALLLIGVVLQPIGWMYSHWLTPVSFVAIVGGVLLVLRGREIEGTAGEGSSVQLSGREMPGDIHGYSGQFSGGRSTSWEYAHSSGSDSSDGGGGD